MSKQVHHGTVNLVLLVTGNTGIVAVVTRMFQLGDFFLL